MPSSDTGPEPSTGGTGPSGDCGNGTVDPGEECDDENVDVGDGCDASCKAEAGWQCPLPGPGSCHQCGNSIKEPLEVCDDGNDLDFHAPEKKRPEGEKRAA